MEFNPAEVEALLHVAHKPDLMFTEGRGMWLTDQAGKRYLDFVQGWAVNCLGHSPDPVREALAEQSGRLVNPSPAFHNAPSAELAALLTRHSCFDRVFFGSSGAEANESAIKLARKWGRLNPAPAGGGARHEIVTFENAFHGRTLATMSASGKPGWDTMFAPQVPGFPKARLNDLDSVAARVNPRTVAVMLEPVQGEGGVIPASAEFLRALRKFTRDQGLLLIVDEVQTGMGRTGALFCHQAADIEPDIMTLGKGIGGGVPLSAMLCRREVACFEPGDQGGTYTGNPLMAAVGVAVAKAVLAPAFLDGVKERGARLSAALGKLSKDHGLQGERGAGLLRALVLGADAAPAVADAARGLQPLGLLVNAPKPGVLRFMPALNVTAAEIDEMAGMLSQALSRVLPRR